MAAVFKRTLRFVLFAKVGNALTIDVTATGKLEYSSENGYVRRADKTLSDQSALAAHRSDLLEHGMTRRVTGYTRYEGWACGGRTNAAEVHVSKDISVGDCQRRCGANMNCGCLEIDRASGVCYMKKAAVCQIDTTCKRSGTSDVYLQQSVWGRDPLRLQRNNGRDCKHGHGAIEIDTHATAPMGLALEACRERCAADTDCTCFKWDRSLGQCHKLKQCNILKCEPSSSVDVYLQEAAENGYDTQYAGSNYGL